MKTTAPPRCAKQRYRNRIDALIELATIQRRDNTTRLGQEKRAYRCPHCHGSHIASRG